mgnify:CR=1 FL=1
MDIDDISMLNFLSRKNRLGDFDYLKKVLNISHNALLVHLNRLKENGFIHIYREKKNYKIKVVFLSPKGKDLLDLLDRIEIMKIPKNLERLPSDNTNKNLNPGVQFQ